MTFLEATTNARAAMIDAGIQPETATLDANLLARHAAGWDTGTWLLRRGETADEGFRQRYGELISRRLRREPVAYIRGTQEFWGREFVVTGDVLIPRPETELLVEEALAFLARKQAVTVVDIGTGSGCIAVSLAAECPSATVYAVDVSEPALTIARINVDRHRVTDRVFLIPGKYLATAPRPCDLIVTNPPYVAERDRRGLAPEVREYEPAEALFGGQDGWRDIRTILREAASALSTDGALMMEMGYGQSERLEEEITRGGGLRLERIREDLQQIPRVAIVRRL